MLAELKRQELIRHIGLSNVTFRQLEEGQKLTEIVCVQNFYNLARRGDDAFIDDLAQRGIAYVPFFRWEDLVRYSRQCSTQQRRHCRPRPCRSRLHGSFSGRPTSC